MKSYEKNNKLKYETKDSNDHIYSQIKEKANHYFSSNGFSKNGNAALWLKIFSLCVLLTAAYYGILHAHSFLSLLFAFTAFGFIFLVIGINIGHDAAHSCVTGNRKFDNALFQLIYGLQGLSGYVWKIRHNFSHHIFPNVYDNDTDLEVSPLILLSPNQEKREIHKYQHLYAPFLYMLFSLNWIFFTDFVMFFKKEHSNITLTKIPVIEITKLVLVKLLYMFIFLVVPITYTGLPLMYVLLAFVSMNFILSLFLGFTFFISHHVLETEYAEAEHNNTVITTSWIEHQIVSTIDFSTENPLGNYIFGGFNLHIAHHIFPDVSHIHYPALTKIIKETLKENNLNWYKSYSFFDGVVSHFLLLKKNGAGIFEHKNEEYSIA